MFNDGGTLLKQPQSFLAPTLMRGLKQLFRRLWSLPQPLRHLLPLSLLAVSLAGCQHVSPSVGTTAASRCSGFRALTYDSKRDTAETVRGNRVHNKTGANLGCWKD